MTVSVFSSSAAAYGMLDVALVTEDMPCTPMNPYGETNWLGNGWSRVRARRAACVAISLRYFNVAGAGDRHLGDATSLDLIPIVLDTVVAGTAPVVSAMTTQRLTAPVSETMSTFSISPKRT